MLSKGYLTQVHFKYKNLIYDDLHGHIAKANYLS